MIFMHLFYLPIVLLLPLPVPRLCRGAPIACLRALSIL